jgi:hypothetical protein
MILTIGEKVTVVYKALGPREEHEGEIVAITKAGFLKIKTKAGHWDDEKFNTSGNNHFARGWNTLWWEKRP